MRAISTTAELISEACAILGIAAWGAQNVSLLTEGGFSALGMLDGMEIRKAGAVVRAGSSDSISAVLEIMDGICSRAAAHTSGDGILSVKPLSPALIISRSDGGYIKSEQKYELIYLAPSE